MNVCAYNTNKIVISVSYLSCYSLLLNPNPYIFLLSPSCVLCPLLHMLLFFSKEDRKLYLCASVKRQFSDFLASVSI